MGVRALHILSLLLVLAAVFGACNEQGRADVWSAAEHPHIAWFQGGKVFAVVDLDTGDWRPHRLKAELIPYTYRKLSNGTLLVSYLGDLLSCGFLLLDTDGRVLYRKDGYAPYVFGEDIVLAVHLGEALEARPAEYAAEVIDTRKPDAAVHYENTLALSPAGYDWRALPNTGSQPPLLLTYTPRGSGADYFYPWAKDFRLTALKQDGSAAWISGIRARRLLTDLELLYTGHGVHLLYGQHDYTRGEYILLDAESGKVMWHAQNTVIPVPKMRYPYVDLLDILPAEVRGYILRFPAYDSGKRKLRVAELDLRQGGIALLDDGGWLAAVDRAFREAQEPPSGVSAWSEDLSGGETLVLTPESLRLSRREAEAWSRPVVPDFGEGLELVSAGNELLFLIERPGRATTMGAQGIPHLIDRSTGKDVRIPVEGEPAVYQPCIFGGKLLLLTTEDARLVEWLPVSGVQPS